MASITDVIITFFPFLQRNATSTNYSYKIPHKEHLIVTIVVGVTLLTVHTYSRLISRVYI